MGLLSPIMKHLRVYRSGSPPCEMTFVYIFMKKTLNPCKEKMEVNYHLLFNISHISRKNVEITKEMLFTTTDEYA